jgi:hypothetical protein
MSVLSGLEDGVEVREGRRGFCVGGTSAVNVVEWLADDDLDLV